MKLNIFRVRWWQSCSSGGHFLFWGFRNIVNGHKFLPLWVGSSSGNSGKGEGGNSVKFHGKGCDVWSGGKYLRYLLILFFEEYSLMVFANFLMFRRKICPIWTLLSPKFFGSIHLYLFWTEKPLMITKFRIVIWLLRRELQYWFQCWVFILIKITFPIHLHSIRIISRMKIRKRAGAEFIYQLEMDSMLV